MAWYGKLNRIFQRERERVGFHRCSIGGARREEKGRKEGERVGELALSHPTSGCSHFQIFDVTATTSNQPPAPGELVVEASTRLSALGGRP